jgi:hypothetical protein
MRKFSLFIAIIIILGIFTSCASTKTYKEQFASIDNMIKANDYAGAIATLEAAKGKYYTEKEKVVYFLDLGMLYHYNKQYKKSNELLTKAEYAIEELFTKNISRAAASMLLNDNVLEYSGEDYEDIYLNIFKALNYLELNQFDDAFVEIRRVNNKLNLLQDKYGDLASQYNASKDVNVKFEPGDTKFHNSALARYLSMLLYRTEGKLDDARIDKEKLQEAWRLQAQLYNFPKPELDTFLNQTDAAKLDCIVFTGLAPDKKANTLYIHTEKDLIIIAASAENPRGNQNLEALDAIEWPGVEKGYHFKFQLPYLEKRKSAVERVEVWVNDERRQVLKPVESIENIAIETFQIKKPLIYLKTIVRTVTKGLLSAEGKQEMEKSIDNPLLGFAARLATDMAVDATENADLRISRFFPKKALAGELQLTAGVYDVKLKYLGENGVVLYEDKRDDVILTKDNLNLIESYYLN